MKEVQQPSAKIAPALSGNPPQALPASPGHRLLHLQTTIGNQKTMTLLNNLLMIRRNEQPPRPAPVASVTTSFNDLPDGQPANDPTGRTHGITVIRRGNELFYTLPAPGRAERQVPRPWNTDVRPPVQKQITSIRWGGPAPFQIAFSVGYGDSMLDAEFNVNFFGEGSFSSLASMWLREPRDMETHPEGMQWERTPGWLQTRRPRGSLFEDAHRYHMPDISYSLYVFADRRADVVEDATGRSLSGKWSDIRDLQILPSGMVHLTWNDPAGEVAVRFDLSSPVYRPAGLGNVLSSGRRDQLVQSLQGAGITLTENGARFTEIELEAAWDLVERWQGQAGLVQSLQANGAPGLTLMKDILNSVASYNTDTGQVKIPGYLAQSPAEQRNTIIHEMTHAVFQAQGLIVSRTAPVPRSVREQAGALLTGSQSGMIDEGAIGARSRPRTQEQWERSLSVNDTLNRIWFLLHRRYPIGDPEGTGDIRGMDVADESRYIGSRRGDPLGHAFDNVSEFLSSFVSSSLRFQPQMLATIERSGDSGLRALYFNLWGWVNANFTRLGRENPYRTG